MSGLRRFWRDCAVCVPLAPGERLSGSLRGELRRLRPGALHLGAPPLQGRAAQMNAQALRSRQPWLFFLHADSRLDPQLVEAAASAHKGRLHYFDLRFAGDGPALTRWNAAAANWRSRLFGLPFGDQGFLIQREDFLRLGGFDDSLAQGEDLDLALRARRSGAGPARLPAWIESSARKYARQGWAWTTLRHVLATFQLAAAGQLRDRRRSPWPGPAAVAVFVKTPGLSPIKTRLSAETGPRRALALYQASLALLQASLLEARASGLFAPVWNVAELKGLGSSLWRKLPARHAGEGSLQEKLAASYTDLLARHRAVFFVGADAPQLGLLHLLRARQALLSHDFVVQGAHDGGYVLFGGRKNLPAQLWLDVPLSRADTGARLVAALGRHGSVATLPPLGDIDRAADLTTVAAELERLEPCLGTIAQAAARLWRRQSRIPSSTRSRPPLRRTAGAQS